MDYKKTFAKTAKEILSKPFKSKQHVCQAIGISVSQFDTWKTEIDEFAEAVSEGFLAGEVRARNFLAKCALNGSKLIDIRMFEKLALDVYGIGANEGEADNEETVNWRIEFVRSKPENTGKAGTFPNEEKAI